MTLDELVERIEGEYRDSLDGFVFEPARACLREQIKALIAEHATMKVRARELTPPRTCPHGRTDEHTHSIACDA